MFTHPLSCVGLLSVVVPKSDYWVNTECYKVTMAEDHMGILLRLKESMYSNAPIEESILKS